jgi:tellurite resistance protein
MSPPASGPSARDFDEPKLEALIEMMVLAADADGEFSADERKHLESSIESLTDRRASGDSLQRLIDRLCADLKASGREKRLASLKERLVDAGERKVALSLAIQLVASDGVIRTSERELLLEVAEALEIDRDEAADLVKKLTP